MEENILVIGKMENRMVKEFIKIPKDKLNILIIFKEKGKIKYHKIKFHKI